MLSPLLRTVSAPVGVVLAVVLSGMSRSVMSVPREGGTWSGSWCNPSGKVLFAVLFDPVLWRYGLPPKSVAPSENRELCPSRDVGRWLRCCCKRCELIGRKKPAAARGTWVLLAEVVGRLCPPMLPEMLEAPTALCKFPPRREDGGACDHRRWFPDCVVVAMDDGRDGGRPGSPGGPVVAATRLPVERCELERCAPASVWWSSSPPGSCGGASSDEAMIADE